MKEVAEFLLALNQCDNSDIACNHHISFSSPATVADLSILDTGLPIPCPDDLKQLLTTSGAFASDSFGDVWNTIKIYSCQELGNRSVGLVDFINDEWGGRPEILEHLSPKEISSLNTDFVVFGYRYIDDDTHDYLYFDRSGRFHHLYFNQDAAQENITVLKKIQHQSTESVSLASLISKQFSEMLAGLDDE